MPRPRPEEQLAPYRPGTDGPFGPRQAGHLLRRTSFGGTQEERRRIVEQGPERAVERLTSSPPIDGAYAEILETLDALSSVQDLAVVQSLWLTRMLRDPVPFREMLTLFWHGHFATSVDKVAQPDMMVRQIDTLREAGAGPFGALLLGMARDPAMIVWLDGNANRRHHPNENFARELFELFSLGIGHYGEDDVLEAARAFTGWHERNGRFRFNAHEHDEGTKTVLGRRGTLDGGDVIDIALEQPACGRFLAAKLFGFFVHADPEPELIEVLGDRYRASDYDTLGLLRMLFTSRVFYSERAYRGLVKSPIALTVGAARSLPVRLNATALAETASDLGQALYAPPSVKGWDGGHAWLNAATLVGRVSFAADLAGSGGDLGVTFTDDTAEDRSLDEWTDLLLDGEMPPDVHRWLSIHMDRFHDARGTLQAVLSLPEYQLA